MNEVFKEELRKLYLDGSKHSNYQSIPEFIGEDLNLQLDLNYEWRGDRSRYRYILEAIKDIYKEHTDIKIADIGANTGYFSLNLAAQKYQVLSYEVNKAHCDFIDKIAKYYNLNNIKTIEQGVTLENINQIERVDSIFLLNVLHHAGVDFEKDKIRNIQELIRYKENYLIKLKERTDFIFLQIGYNWGGNKSLPIIDPMDYCEMFYLIQNIATKTECHIYDCAVYNKRKDEYISILAILKEKEELEYYLEKIEFAKNSEFYKRPIVILKSKRQEG